MTCLRLFIKLSCRQDKARQDKARQDKARQDKARQVKAGHKSKNRRERYGKANLGIRFFKRSLRSGHDI